jgi:undecaprenyl pyrophosphate synthase
MKEGSIFLTDLEFEYRLWKNRLSYYLKELALLKARNEELLQRDEARAMNTVELMVLEDHESELQQLEKRIKVQEEEMQYNNKDFPITPTHEYMGTHLILRDKINRICALHRDKADDLLRALGI